MPPAKRKPRRPTARIVRRPRPGPRTPRAAPSPLPHLPLPTPPPLAPIGPTSAPEVPSVRTWDLIGLTFIAVGLILLHFLLDVALGYPLSTLTHDTLYFLLPTLLAAFIIGTGFTLAPAQRWVVGALLVLDVPLSYALPADLRAPLWELVPVFAAILLAGTRLRLTPRRRVAYAAAYAAAVLLPVFFLDRTQYYVLVNFTPFELLIRYFPFLAAIAVPGPRRFQWRATQIFGLALLTIPLWRSLYFSLPDIAPAFQPGGVELAIPLVGLWRTFSLKAFREILFPAVGLVLLVGRFPWAQKIPRWKQDLAGVLGSIQGHTRRGLVLDLGWGAGLLVLNIQFAISLQDALSRVRTLDTGDDSQVFNNITPALVLLLSLVAGIGEELLFRGLLQPFLARSLRDLGRLAFPLALVLQALFFAVVHAGYGNLIHILLPLTFGLFMGLVYRYLGLLPCILIHTEIDIFAFGASAQAQYPWVGQATVILFFVNVAAGLVTFIYEAIRWWERRAHAPPQRDDRA